MDSLIATDDYW